MRVLFLVPDLKRASGISVLAVETAEALNQLGMTVDVAAVVDDADRYPTDGLKVLSADAILPRIKSREWDIVHIHGLWTLFYHKVCRAARKARIPYVISPHGMLTPWALRNKRIKKFLGLLAYQWIDLRLARWLHATAASEVADFRRIGLCNKCVVAPLGVRLPLGRARASGRSGARVLLFVGRVQRKKGLPNLVEAWSRVSENLRRDWQVRIVGPDQDDHIAELKSRCERLGIDFVFVGPKYGDELAAEYDNADLFVLPTHSENFGSVVVEALAHEVPVITTRGTPWAELEDRRCGWWIDIGVDPLAKALEAAMRLSVEERATMGERGCQLVREKFTWDAVAATLRKEYCASSSPQVCFNQILAQV